MILNGNDGNDGEGVDCIYHTRIGTGGERL